MIDRGRKERVLRQIAAAGLLTPCAVTFSSAGTGIAVSFVIDSVVETVEGCGDSDDAAADDVVRQVRERIASGGV